MTARHRRSAAPVVRAVVALGVLGTAAAAGGAASGVPADHGSSDLAVRAPLLEATLPPAPALRRRDAITDLGF